jgi:FtsH-binding integral membrane protein
MALIAPGAFLWLTYAMQSLYGAPMAGSAMWFGIVAALLLCFAAAAARRRRRSGAIGWRT